MSGEVLVTGAAGFVGRHTTSACLEAGFEVTGVDVRPPPGYLVGQARWLERDCADGDLLAEIAAGRYLAVLHQAGISDTRVPACPALERTNVGLPALIAQACRAGQVRFVYASSHAVYGVLRRHEPITEGAEDDPGRCSGPLNPYAASKLSLDRLMRARFAEGLEWVGLRYTNVFGPDEHDKGPMACILSQLLRRAATDGRIRLFGDSLRAARDYIPVETVAATLALLARRPVPAGVYNLGSGHAFAFAEVLEWCASLRQEAGGSPLEVTLIPNSVAAAYQYYTCADMRALDDVLPNRPVVTVEEIRDRAAALFTAFGAERGAPLGRVTRSVAGR